MKYVFSIKEQNGAQVIIKAVITYPTDKIQTLYLGATVDKRIGQVLPDLLDIQSKILDVKVRQDFVFKLKVFLRSLLVEPKDR